MNGSIKIIILCIGLSCLMNTGSPQKVSLLKLDELESRTKAGGDTTFIINFWATWCAPCIEELPNFEKLHTNYKTGKLAILLVSVDFKSQLNRQLIPFVKKHALKNDVYLLDEDDQQAYINRIDSSWSGAIPASLFIRGNKRKFIERQLSYKALLNEFQTF